MLHLCHKIQVIYIYTKNINECIVYFIDKKILRIVSNSKSIKLVLY